MSLRSRRQHKAWGEAKRNPRLRANKKPSARESGRQSCEKIRLIDHRRGSSDRVRDGSRCLRLGRLMCGRSLTVYDLPKHTSMNIGAMPLMRRRSLAESRTNSHGKAEPFRTSGGRAATRSLVSGDCPHPQEAQVAGCPSVMMRSES